MLAHPDHPVTLGLTRKDVAALDPAFEIAVRVNDELNLVPVPATAESGMAKLRRAPAGEISRRERLAVDRMLAIGLGVAKALSLEAVDTPAARAAHDKLHRAG